MVSNRAIGQSRGTEPTKVHVAATPNVLINAIDFKIIRRVIVVHDSQVATQLIDKVGEATYQHR